MKATGAARAGRLALFRCDAGPEIGGGHVYRCLALATSLDWLGWRCRFLTRPGSAAAAPALTKAGWPLDEAAEEGDEIDRVARLRPDLLVIDSHERGIGFETACRPHGGHILVLADAPDRDHVCDALLDAGLGEEGRRHAGKVPREARLLLGPDYALLRPGFAAARPAALRRRREREAIRRIHIGFGAADRHGLTRLTAEAALAAIPSAEIDLVAGSASLGLDHLRGFVAREPRCRLFVDHDDVAALMAEADLAIGAAGGAVWERAALGLPSLLVAVADNQARNLREIVAAGAASGLGHARELTTERITAALSVVAHAPATRRAMAERAAGLCDGRGARRVPLALLPPVAARDGRGVVLRLGREADEEILLAWQRAPAVRRFARNPGVPDPDEHRTWLESALASPDRLLTIIEHNGRPAGMLRLDAVAGAETLEVSILVAPELHGRGIGTAALSLARAVTDRDLVAEVKAENTASLALFAAAGYRAAGPNRYRSQRAPIS